MTPLQWVAMGLVLTLVDADIGGYDAVPDVLGWVMVVPALLRLRDVLATTTLVGLAVLAGMASLTTLRPDLIEDLPESTGWLLSLPQFAFSLLLSVELGRAVPRLARRFGVLAWTFGVAAVGPVLLYGGGVDVLLVPLAVLTVLANVYLVYLLFRVARVGLGTNVPPSG
ncbi:hypothetical protein [Nocardioides pakistanensis]